MRRVALGGSERLCDLRDRGGLLVRHATLGLRGRRRDVEHQAAVRVQFVGSLGAEHCDGLLESAHRPLRDLLRRRNHAETGAMSSREVAYELAVALAMRRKLL